MTFGGLVVTTMEVLSFAAMPVEAEVKQTSMGGSTLKVGADCGLSAEFLM